MPGLRVIPIVEGHGEVESMRTLLQRIGIELLDSTHVEVLTPIRQNKGKLCTQEGLVKAVRLAAMKLGVGTEYRDLILILLDADKDCPAELAAQIAAWAETERSDADVACVVAKVEFETWFVAAAASLADRLALGPDEEIPADPEGAGCGKRWVEKRFRGVRYSPTIDQPGMTANMDLRECRARSPSFDKLCREIEKRAG